MTSKNSIDPQGFTGKLARYFADNPDEELLYDDACAKLGCSRKRLVMTVARLKALGLIEVAHVIRAAPGRQRDRAGVVA